MSSAQTYPREAYGTNPLGNYNPNGDNGWNLVWRFPNGVPASQIGVASYRGINAYVRLELVELELLIMRVAWEVFQYVLVVGWCWFYENRAIANSGGRPSNHSRAICSDWNAPDNPYASGANFRSTIPPRLVAFLAAVGYYWGGYYGDTMHKERVWGPAQVPADVAYAKRFLLENSVVKPKPPAAPAPYKPMKYQLPKGAAYGLKNAVKPAGTNKIVWGGASATVTSRANIRRLQERLIVLGHLAKGGADGTFGVKTAAAVKLFQKSQHGKVRVSGVVGPVTWRLLKVQET